MSECRSLSIGISYICFCCQRLIEILFAKHWTVLFFRTLFGMSSILLVDQRFTFLTVIFTSWGHLRIVRGLSLKSRSFKNRNVIQSKLCNDKPFYCMFIFLCGNSHEKLELLHTILQFLIRKCNVQSVHFEFCIPCESIVVIKLLSPFVTHHFFVWD